MTLTSFKTITLINHHSLIRTYQPLPAPKPAELIHPSTPYPLQPGFHDAHAAALVVHHLLLNLLEYFQGHGAGSCREVVDAAFCHGHKHRSLQKATAEPPGISRLFWATATFMAGVEFRSTEDMSLKPDRGWEWGWKKLEVAPSQILGVRQRNWPLGGLAFIKIWESDQAEDQVFIPWVIHKWWYPAAHVILIGKSTSYDTLGIIKIEPPKNEGLMIMNVHYCKQWKLDPHLTF